MAFTTDIKKRRNSNIKIKKLEKAQIYSQRLKDNIIKINKEASSNEINRQEDTPTEYGTNQVIYGIKTIANKSINKVEQQGKKSMQQTRKNIEKSVQKIRDIKQSSKKLEKANNKIKNTNLKKKKREIKEAVRATQKTVKTTKRITKETVRGAKKAYQTTKETAKNAGKGIKIGVKATISIMKTIIAGTKALLSAIIAGGWVAVLIIIVICVIAMICCSVFGIFFSNEENVGDKTMSEVIREIDSEFSNKIAEIQKDNQYDEYAIEYNRAEWKDILSIYAVVIGNGKNATDAVSLDEQKIDKLKEIFWEMNFINSRVETKEIEAIDENGGMTKTTKNILYIDIESKTIEEMMRKYNLNEKQRKQIVELQKDEYNSMWNYVVYGSSMNGNQIVTIALSQVGNVGGQPYWSWYGFNNRVEWCACFVSWCANQCGLIEKGTIPKFSACVDGVAWFKRNNRWYDRKQRGCPITGDIIFFDWRKKNNGGQDGVPDHVGIVKEVKDNRVYTVEGNSGDRCKENSYALDEMQILGYGIAIS